MAAAGHPPATLPPPSTQPFQHSCSPYKGAPEPYGDPYTSGEPHRHHIHYAGTGRPGPYPPPPPPPPYNSRPYDTRHPGGSIPGEESVTRVSIPSTVYVAPPKLQMQPWARKCWRWLVDNTTGVARVDLRRPTLSPPEQYDGNLLVVRSRQSVATQPGGGGGVSAGFQQPVGGRGEPAAPAYGSPPYGPVYGQTYPAASPPTGVLTMARQPLLMGARIKITRRFIFGGGRAQAATHDHDDTGVQEAKEESQGALEEGTLAASKSGETAATTVPSVESASVSAAYASHRRRRARITPPQPVRGSPLARSWAEKPLLDFGVGINLDVDQQEIQPVARIKIKDFVSIKMAPMALLKISRSIPLGPVALKVRYELPLSHARRCWEPPARLMVRLDNAAGSGVHLTPGGLDFDEVLQFGSSVSLRTSASMLFPRQLPLEAGERPLRLQLHRLSLKSIW